MVWNHPELKAAALQIRLENQGEHLSTLAIAHIRTQFLEDIRFLSAQGLITNRQKKFEEPVVRKRWYRDDPRKKANRFKQQWSG